MANDGRVNDGGPAFPVTAGNDVYAQGITRRDWFAGQALVGLMASGCLKEGWSTSDIAEQAFIAGDAMMEARDEY